MLGQSSRLALNVSVGVALNEAAQLPGMCGVMTLDGDTPAHKNTLENTLSNNFTGDAEIFFVLHWFSIKKKKKLRVQCIC